jgi:hypothetical protein
MSDFDDLVFQPVKYEDVKHNYQPRHLEAAIAFLSLHRETFPWETLVSPPMPLQRLEEAFALAESGRWARVAIDPSLIRDCSRNVTALDSAI